MYHGTSKHSRTVPSLASEVELRRALDSLKTSSEADYSGVVGSSGRGGGWRNVEPAHPVSVRGSYSSNEGSSYSAASELNRFYDELEQALYLDCPRSRTEPSYGQSLGQYNSQPRYF